jgi:hypothetical protein
VGKVGPGTHHKPVVGPRSELHGTLLVVEREPGDVDLAGAFEDAGRDVIATAVVAHHHVRLVSVVKSLVCTTKQFIMTRLF